MIKSTDQGMRYSPMATNLRAPILMVNLKASEHSLVPLNPMRALGLMVYDKGEVSGTTVSSRLMRVNGSKVRQQAKVTCCTPQAPSMRVSF